MELLLYKPYIIGLIGKITTFVIDNKQDNQFANDFKGI